MSSRCSTCGEFTIWDSHKCAPRFLCWIEHIGGYSYDYTEEDATEVYAYDAQAAAVRHAEEWDWRESEPQMLNDTGFVMVRDPREDTLHRFAVEGEMSPSYRASEWTLDDGWRALGRAIRQAFWDMDALLSKLSQEDRPLPSWLEVDGSADAFNPDSGDRIILTELVGYIEWRDSYRTPTDKTP